MGKEAFQDYGNLALARTEGSAAFNLAYYERQFSLAGLKRDVISYLGEYRLKEKKHTYFLDFSDGSDGGRLRDPNSGESMFFKGKLAIERKKALRETSRREEAELLGIQSLDRQLISTSAGDTILWASPPGPKEEGYGDYGFFYFGKVKDSPSGKTLEMKALRVESPSILQFNTAFSRLTNENVKFINAEAFLASPKVLKVDLAEKEVDRVLFETFSFQESEEEVKINQRILNEMSPMIEEFINLGQRAGKEERLRAFHALENFALDRKRVHEAKDPRISDLNDNRRLDLAYLLRVYAYKPPEALGSCGPSVQKKSNDIFNNGPESLKSFLEGDKESYGFDETGTCVNCGKENVLLGPCKICQPCDQKLRRDA